MQPAILTSYSLGSIAILSTSAVAILNGLSYATLKPSTATPGSGPALELAIVSLHALSCVELVALALLLGNRKTLSDQTPWKTWVCCCISAILLLTTAATAAATAWKTAQSVQVRSRALFISQCVIWAVSIFNQGLFCGFLLIGAIRREDEEEGGWGCRDTEIRYNNYSYPSSAGKWKGKGSRGTPVEVSSLQEPHLRAPPSTPKRSSTISPTAIPKEPAPLSPVKSFTANIGSQVFNRYSGRTLYQPENSRPASIDSVLPSEPHSRREENRDSGHSSHIRSRKIQKLLCSDVKTSLDGLVSSPGGGGGGGPSSPISVSTDFSKPSPVVALNAPVEDQDQNHIHPLFRTGSASPPPTPAPGTTVTASPVAGQTISFEMLGRVRSSNSMYGGERSYGGLFESVGSLDDALEGPEGLAKGLSCCEKGNGLSESPLES